VGAQRVTDGNVALDGERRYGQHGRRRRHLGEKRLEATVRLAEDPRIRAPDRVQLRRQTCNNAQRRRRRVKYRSHHTGVGGC